MLGRRTNRLLCTVGFVLQLRAEGSLSHSSGSSDLGSGHWRCTWRPRPIDGRGPGGGARAHLAEMDLQGPSAQAALPLSINSPLACGTGVASNSLIYATEVLLTN